MGISKRPANDKQMENDMNLNDEVAATPAEETAGTEAAAAAGTEAAKPEKAPKVEMPTQNGIRAPRTGGLCDRVWQVCYNLGQELGRVPAMSEVVAAGLAAGLNEGNIRVEYSRWKKFNGITQRIPDPAKAEKAAQKEAEKVAKQAEKEAKAAEKAAEKAAKKEAADAAKAAKAAERIAEKEAKAKAAADAAAAAAAEEAPAAPEA